METINFIAKIFIVITFFANCILGILILQKKPRRKSTVFFSLFIFSLALWNLTYIGLHTGIRYLLSYDQLFWLEKSAIIFTTLISFSFLLFAISFFTRTMLSRWKTVIIFLVPAVLILLSPFDYYFSEVKVLDWGTYYKPSFMYPVFGIYFLIYIFLGNLILIDKYKRSANKILKIQIKFIIWGTSIATIFGLFLVFLLPLLLDIYSLAPISILSSSLVALIVSYVILRYRFLSIKLTLQKIAVFLFSLLIASLFYSLFFILIDRYLFAQILPSTNTKIFLIAIIIVATASLLKNISEAICKFIIKLGRQRTIIDLFQSKEVRSMSLYTLLEAMAREIEKRTGSAKAIFLFYDDRISKFREEHPGHSLLLDKDDELLEYLRKNKDIVILDEISYLSKLPETANQNQLGNIESTMRKLGVALVMPLFISGDEEMVGVIILHAKTSNKLYNLDDIIFLRKYGEEMSMPLSYGLMYKTALERAGIDEAMRRKMYGLDR